MAAGFQPRSFIKQPQSGDLWPHEPADEQATSRDQRVTKRGRQAHQRPFKNIRYHEIKARAPVIGGVAAESNLNLVAVQVCVHLGAGQGDSINVGSDDELSTASTSDAGKNSRTGSHIQNRLRPLLPAKQVHRCGTQPRGCVRSVAKYRAVLFRRQLRECNPAFLEERRRRAGGIHRNPGGNAMHVKGIVARRVQK